jgi:hypothetical protein
MEVKEVWGEPPLAQGKTDKSGDRQEGFGSEDS